MSSNERRMALLAAARRQRVAWIESARNDPEAGERSTASVMMLEGAKEVLSCLPSSMRLFSLLDEIGGSHEYGLIDATEFHDEMPIPTHSALKGASAYDIFLEKLKHAKAAEIVKIMEHFVISFLKMDIARAAESPLEEEKPWNVIQSFLERVTSQMRDSPVWATESPAEWDRSVVAAESFIFSKVGHVLVTDEERKERKELHERIRSLAFIDTEHLDIRARPPDEEWATAEAILRSLSRESGPTGKIEVIVELSKEIMRVLAKSSAGSSLPGADDFLPAMILIVKRENPESLHSDLNLIQHYSAPVRLMSEAGYVFCHLQSAVSFLRTLDASALSITPADFDRGLQRCQEIARQDMARALSGIEDDGEGISKNKQHHQTPESPKIDRPLTIHEVRRLRQGQAGTVRKRKDCPKDTVSRTTHRFMGKKPEDLLISEVPELLKEYRQLVYLCEALLADKEETANTRPRPVSP